MPEEELAARLGKALVVEGTAAGLAARELLDQAHVGFLGTHDADGPYVVPVSFAYDGGEVVQPARGPRQEGGCARGRPPRLPHGLRAIIAKYHPERVDAPLPRKTVAKTVVYRMEIRALTFRRHPDD